MEMQDLGYDYVKLLEEKIKELEQKLEKANMKDPLEFDSETIFKLEALLANSVRMNEELKRNVAYQHDEFLSKLFIAAEALESISKEVSQGYSSDPPTRGAIKAKEALTKIGAL